MDGTSCPPLTQQQQHRKGSDAFSETTLYSNTSGNGNGNENKYYNAGNNYNMINNKNTNQSGNGGELISRIPTMDSTDSNQTLYNNNQQQQQQNSSSINIKYNNNNSNNNNYYPSQSCTSSGFSSSGNEYTYSSATTNFSHRTSFLSSPCSSLTSFNNFNILFNRLPLNLEERYETTLPILTLDMAEQIRNKIPSLYKEAVHWKLLYSIDQHGTSLKTLYSNVRNAGPCVMALLTEENEIFGAFTSEPFDPTISNRFYGSGLSFLWKYNNQTKAIKFYEALSTNQYYMLADNKFIAMGGGDGKFGFYLNQNLINGYISPCMTYTYNDSIIENENFECYGLEIWGFEF